MSIFLQSKKLDELGQKCQQWRSIKWDYIIHMIFITIQNVIITHVFEWLHYTVILVAVQL